MSRLRRYVHGVGWRLRSTYRSLGPRRAAALAAALLAAGVGAAVAVAMAGGHLHGQHVRLAGRAAKQPGGAVTQTSGLPGAGHRPAAAHRSRPHVNRRQPVVPSKPAKRAGARSPQPSSHQRTANQASQPSHTTPTTTTTTASPAPTSVTLDIHAGGNASLMACGSQQHFRTYAAGTVLSFTGAVQPVPSEPWGVKLHFKICQGGAYQDFSKVDAHTNNGTGAFHGTFSAPPRGLYEVEAVLYLRGTESAPESSNVNLKIR
jgi:hypothetical protein